MNPMILILLFALTALTACEQPKTNTAPQTKETAKTATQKTTTPKSSTVKVADKGTNFDPPIKSDVLPKGAHYCDMGTVHYARMLKGDNKCTRCGMALKHKQ